MHVEQTKQTEKRDKLDIMIELLQVAKEPIKKTRIMQVAYLNFYQVSKYLDYLIGAGLLESITKPYPGFRITEKGRMFLVLLTVTDYKQAIAEGEAAAKPENDGTYLQLGQIEDVLKEVFKEDAVALLMEKIRSAAKK
ncbi:MAG: winged helix-turn-helix domain-containing protein [Nitrososphaera sp.]|nr:winged helix-turn-helix domain-containing protein [Nitrososphaera sp.]